LFILLFVASTFSIGYADSRLTIDYYQYWEDFDVEDIRNKVIDYQKEDWNKLSQSLRENVAADDPHTQRVAMREIILYNYLSKNSLDLDETVFDLLTIYEESENTKVKQLAIVTLHSIGNEWSMDYLCDSIKFEKDKNLKKFMAFCVCDYRKNAIATIHLAN
jgi:hypothetical protein